MAVKIFDRPGIGGNLLGKEDFDGMYGSEILLAADDREMKVAPSFYACLLYTSPSPRDTR